ncbi:MAG: hypothetical protein KGJ87_05215 [Planctomycetota bacterium]|nr:hypothetical protein [Planctomycetota bacterium]
MEEDKQAELFKVLRDEATHVKDCFTKYSYYGLLFSSAVLSLILKFVVGCPAVALSGIVTMIFLLSIARIGIYKYGTANRNCGYQLYIERAKTLDDTNSKSWKKYMLQIGWEEAMSTWRFVQASVFNYIYETRFYRLHSVKLKISDPWFQPRTAWELKNDSDDFPLQYHAGTYLRTMLNIMYFTILISLLPMVFMIIKVHNEYRSGLLTLLSTLPLVLSALYMVFRIARNNSKVRILEEGLLSIYSCSIMWQAVVTAHFIALSRVQQANAGPFSFHTYYKELKVETIRLLNTIAFIEKYIYGATN